MSAKKLKLGLLLDSFDVPAWVFHSLEQIAKSDYAEFLLILIKNSNQQDNPDRFFTKLWRHRSAFVYETLNKIDEKLFVRGRSAFAMMNLQNMMAKVPVVSITPVNKSNIDIIQSEDVETIRDYDLDILIQVGFQALGGEIITAAKYGIWFVEHSDERTKRGGPRGFWEVMESWPVTGSALLVSDDQFPQSRRAVYRSSIMTYPFSPARTRNTSFWVSASFLPRQIELLSRLGEARFFQETARYNREFGFCDGRHYQTPTNLNAIKLYTRLLFRDLYETYQRLSRLESWYLMFDFSNSTSLAFENFNKIMPPKDRFWADPQVIKKDDKYFIFVEEFIYKYHKGHISVIELDAKGHYKVSVPVLETDYHLSYPFVFECDNQYYMVPESAENRSIDLYECASFPTEWKFKQRLMDNVIAKDTTLFFHNGKWWLFTGITENENALPEVELFLFYSDNLFSSEWRSHPLNPVLSDVTCARPAGKIFTIGSKIYRPSQDCSKNYGSGFNLNEIVCLTETDYLEKKVAGVKPNWDDRLIGTHTFTRVDGLTIVDGLSRRSKWF